LTNTLESFVIQSPEYGKSYKIDLVEGLEELHIKHIEDVWQPILNNQYSLALLHFYTQPSGLQTHEVLLDTLGKFCVADNHWSWRRKCNIALGSNRKTYGLLNNSEVEAVMMLKFGELSRCSPSGMPIVYVDYISVAPWNRTPIQDPRRFRSLGTVMLGAAVEMSRTLGMDGRCGLHSLPSSEWLYQLHMMKEFGTDSSHQNLKYFEFDQEAAMNFLNK